MFYRHDKTYNTLRFTNIGFKWVQSIRLVMLLTVLVFVFIMMYILARISFFYINVWSLMLFFATLILISSSAGR
jgi:hypothetical protein